MQSKPVLLFLAVLLFIFAWGVFGFISKTGATRENRKISENKVAELERKKEKLSADIAKLETDEGVEENIRQKFGLAKEGEGVIIIVEDPNKPEIPKEESKGFWSFFADWLE